MSGTQDAANERRRDLSGQSLSLNEVSVKYVQTCIHVPSDLDSLDSATVFCLLLSRKLLGKRKRGSDDKKISVPMIMNPSHQAPTKRGSFLSSPDSSVFVCV